MFLLLLLLFWVINCEKSPNFVVILTDDQDLLLNSLLAMEKARNLISNHGVTFSNAFVNSPICCPSRSTLLTGFYAHNLQVYNNSLSGGCASATWRNKFEPIALAPMLKSKNYSTFYAGKYLNQYGLKKSGGSKHIPDGYDWWLGLIGNSKYYNYSLSINGTKKFYANTYLTDNIANHALDYLSQHCATNHPFLMILAPPAPHSPFTPAVRHLNKFPNAKCVKNPAFNYTKFNQKHWLVEMHPNYLPSDSSTILDEIQRSRLQTLLAVDDLIEKIVQKLIKINILNNTYIILTSDNGFHIGQFSQPWDKRQPYEADIRVPLLIRGPKVSKKHLSDYPVSTIDLVPTILDLSNAFNWSFINKFDGKSFKKYLFNNNKEIYYNKFILIEYWGEANKKTVDKNCFKPDQSLDLADCTLGNWCKCQDSKNNTYSCILHYSPDIKYKYCEFYDDSNFVEAYDLIEDPYELNNLYFLMESSQVQFYKNLLDKLKKCKGKNCNLIK